MSIITEYRDAAAKLEALQAQLKQLESNDELLLEMEFEEKLRELMGVYGKSLRDIIAILDPQAFTSKPSAAAKTNRPRSVKTYKNPHNGEIVETKGGNHKVLKAWKAEYGAEVVDSWLA